MSDAVTATYVFDEAQWKAAQKVYRKVPLMRAMRAFVMICNGFMIWWAVSALLRGSRPTDIDFVFPAGTLVTLALARVFREKRELKLFKHSAAFGRRIVATFDSTELKLEMDAGRSSTRLDIYPTATIAPTGMLIFQHARHFFWVPASGFATPEDFAVACGRVKANVKKVKDRR